MTSSRYPALSVSLVLLLLTLFLPLPAVQAASITVDADCSLANAITAANSDSNTHDSDCTAGSGADTITLTADITLSAALPDIDGSLTIEGGGHTISGNNAVRIFFVDGSSGSTTVTINNLIMTRGRSTDSPGAAIRVVAAALIVRNSVVSNSTAQGAQGSGGGIAANDSIVTIENSVFTGNSSSHSSASGGAIRASASVNGPSLTIKNSSFSGNSTAGSGGAVFSFTLPMTIENSTFYSNSATNNGGGLKIDGAASLRHVTIANNTGGGLTKGSGTVSLYNSLLAGNSGGDCSGTLNANIGNLIRDGSCATTGLLTGDPRLGPLAGSPPWYTLLANSPAIDAANAAQCAALSEAVDQAGTSRPQGSACDIGAFEYVPPPPPPPPPPEQDQGESSPDRERRDRVSAMPAPVRTCESLPESILVRAAHDGPQCQQVGASGVGIKEIVDAGFIDAVDIWSYLGRGVEVCFRNIGSLLFLDAAHAPRRVSSLTSYSRAGMICTWLERAGTVVLVPGPAPAPVADSIVKLQNCMVTTTHIVNLRDGPAGNIINGLIPYNVTLTAMERAAGWFYVDYHGAKGWISADYVTTRGTCGE